jgi:hypothetical protein
MPAQKDRSGAGARQTQRTSGETDGSDPGTPNATLRYRFVDPRHLPAWTNLGFPVDMPEPEFEAIMSFLAELHQDGSYTPPLSLRQIDPMRFGILRRLSALELIRWCPYPDECYVFETAGETLFLAMSPTNS